jgi:asparagine synthase (glutamine-hydrolysing)
MCGICGFFGFHDDHLIHEMMDAISHRGPDARGFMADDQVTFGHTRLSIIDLSERGRQPLTNETGDIWITYNGEVYNFLSLKKDLTGHRFVSDTDTEVLVHAYEEYGIQFLEKLRGMFAFALYDQKKKVIVLARDPIGKKPLYYHWDGRHLLFASEIKSILKAFDGLKIPRTIARHALCSYVKNQYVAGPKTLVSGILRLPPGSYLTVSLDSGKCEVFSYWKIQESIDNGNTEDYFASTLCNLLRESVRLRLIADVPVGSFLSGGIDSSGITAIAKQSVPYDFHTFTAGFGDANSDMKFARDVSLDLDTVHHEIEINPAEVLKDFDRITWNFDEPLGDAAVIANYYLAKEARHYVKVVLAGEGSDELFGGYSSYRAGQRWYPWFRLPEITRSLVDKAISFIPGSGNPLRDRRFVYAHYLGQKSPEMAQQYSWQITGITDDEQRWMGFSSCTGFTDTVSIPSGVTDPLNRLLVFDCQNHLPDLYLMKADKATMAHSVEERVPILDKDLISFSFTIPPRLKIFNGVEKYIWRKALQGIVSREILNRPKKGFGVPYTDWISGELRESAVQALDEGVLCRTLADPRKLDKIVSGMSPDKSNRSSLIVWNLFALERWAKVFALQEIT